MTTKIKDATIDAIVNALCSSKSLTRSEIAQRANVSPSTAAKVISLLLSSGAIVERCTYNSENNALPSRLSISDKIYTAVIDLSSPVYSFNVISGGEMKFRYTHAYDPNIDFRDNLYALLSRAIANARIIKGATLGFCILYSDARKDQPTKAYLPGICDKDIISGVVYDVLKRHPYTYIAKSQAVLDAARFNIISRAEGYGGVSYLFIGSSISAFSVLNDGKLVCPDIQNFIIGNGITVGNYIKNCVTRNDFEKLLATAVSFIDTAYGAQTLIIESDTFKIDEACVKMLARHYTAARLSLPTIYPVYSGEQETDICILSAARRTEATIVRSHILCVT